MDRYLWTAYKTSESQQVSSQKSKQKIQHRTQGQYTTVHKAPEAEGKAREASTIVCRTVQGTTDDWTQCCQARVTTGDKGIPHI